MLRIDGAKSGDNTLGVLRLSISSWLYLLCNLEFSPLAFQRSDLLKNSLDIIGNLCKFFRRHMILATFGKFLQRYRHPSKVSNIFQRVANAL